MDVEHAATAEDAVALLASGMRKLVPRGVSWSQILGNTFSNRVKGIGLGDFSVQFRAQVHGGNWQRVGMELIRAGAQHSHPLLIVIYELPVFLQRLLRKDDGSEHVDIFLSWLRSAIQQVPKGSLSSIVTGSIGLMPLVERLGIPDRVNYLHPFRLSPWDEATSIECFHSQAESESIHVEPGVPRAV